MDANFLLRFNPRAHTSHVPSPLATQGPDLEAAGPVPVCHPP